MINRRTYLSFVAVLGASLGTAGTLPATAWAQGTDKASAFVKETGAKLVSVVNGPGSATEKRSAMSQIIDSSVDVDGVGKFCLGRYWRQATPEQQERYLKLFHEVLITNITSKLGEYKGVTFTMGRSRMEDDQAVVSTTVDRPNSGPTAVDWIISNPAAAPKIIDVIAEGTSLRLTQRSDYASYLVHNNNNINALITAMQQQVTANASG